MSNPIKKAITFIGNFLTDSLLLITALTGIGVGLTKFFSDDLFTSDELNFMLLGIVGLIATSFWIERRKTKKMMDDHFQSISQKIYSIENNAQLFNILMNLSNETREELVSFAEYFDQHHKTMPLFEDPAQKVVKTTRDELLLRFKSLAEGQLNSPKHESPHANAAIMDTFRKRMDAVSVDDLDFWMDPTGQQYVLKSIEKRNRKHRGAEVTRIFIVKRSEFQNKSEALLKVLEDHFAKSIGFAIAIHDGLKDIITRIARDQSQNQSPSMRLDFALFDSDKAVTYFRSETIPRFVAYVATNSPEHPNNQLIRRQRELWIDLICECWVVSRRFVNSVLPNLSAEEKKKIEDSTSEDNQAIFDITGFKVEDDIFPLVISDREEIESKAKKAFDLYTEKNGS